MKMKIIDVPHLMKEWNFEKNNKLELYPDKLSVNSHKKTWWVCENGHEWMASIANRYRLGRGCPYCAHQIPIKGETDLEATYPNIANEWDFQKNDLLPNEVFPGSNKKVWWLCKKGHEYQATIKSRTNGSGCPYCAGQKVLKGFNDLESRYPEIAKEWHPIKNIELTPDKISYSSSRKVWWQCKFGHEWEATVYNRINGRSCPICSRSMRTSFPEQAIYFYIRQLFPDAINSYKDIFSTSMELDIFIPSIKFAIEYDGIAFHSNNSNRLRDVRKYNICKNHGIKLLRIKEMGHGKPHLCDCDYRFNIPNAKSLNLNSAISTVCHMLSKKIIDVDVDRDHYFILKQLNEKRLSLAELYPELCLEWDYDKNLGLKPEQFSPHSNEKVYWKCKNCSFSWIAAIGDRTRYNSTGCPKCAIEGSILKRQEALLNKKGSLADNYPQLLDEWDFNKNLDISPRNILAGSGKKVWWKCKKCGHEWKTSVHHRANGRNCPLCRNRVVIKGKNDLFTLMPGLEKQWDFKKNENIDPLGLSAGSGKKVWWKCEICGHEWETSIISRSKGSGCPNYRKHNIVHLNQIEIEDL